MASYEVESVYLTLLSDMGKYSLRDKEKKGKKNQKQTNLHLRVDHTMPDSLA